MAPANLPPPTSKDPHRLKQKGKPKAWMVPFVFLGFIFGLSNLIATPVLYIYEIIEYNKSKSGGMEGEWPGWSVVDGVNWAFFERQPMFFSKGVLYHWDRTPVIHLHGAVADVLNTIIYYYGDASIVLIALLNGAICMTLSVRAALFSMNAG